MTVVALVLTSWVAGGIVSLLPVQPVLRLDTAAQIPAHQDMLGTLGRSCLR